MSIEIRREGEIEFSKPLARALFRDPRLSFSARGLFAFLWDLPADWLIRSTWLATRGPDGKDAIRARLAELRAVGAMRIEPLREADGKVAGTRWVLISPEKWAKAAPLSHSTESGISRLSAFPTIGEPAAKVLQEVKVLQDEAAARAPARIAVAAAAHQEKRQKRRVVRASGIVTWTPDDHPEAERIELQHGVDVIGAAVAALTATSKEPVPGLVAREIDRQRRAHEAAERQAATEAAQAASPFLVDPATLQHGSQLMANIRRSRICKPEAKQQ